MGTGCDISIRELAEEVASAVGFKGAIEWDQSKPDGTPKKQLDVSRLRQMGWSSRIPLEEGLPLAVEDYKQSLTNGQLRQ